jgi:hypothetical protein
MGFVNGYYLKRCNENNIFHAIVYAAVADAVRFLVIGTCGLTSLASDIIIFTIWRKL